MARTYRRLTTGERYIAGEPDLSGVGPWQRRPARVGKRGRTWAATCNCYDCSGRAREANHKQRRRKRRAIEDDLRAG